MLLKDIRSIHLTETLSLLNRDNGFQRNYILPHDGILLVTKSV